MDKLAISSIKLTTLIGVNAWEQRCPQTLFLDLCLQTDARQLSQDDNLTQGVDYDKVVAHLRQFVQDHQFQLIETLAEHLAREILTHFPTKWVQLSLRKPGAILHAKEATITIERSK